MAAFISEVATLGESASVTTHTLTLAVGKSVAVGDLMVMVITMASASTTFGTPTDSGSNTWVAGTTINATSLGAKSTLFWCVATGALTATNTVQFTTSSSTRGAGYILNFSGSSGTSATVNDVVTTGSNTVAGTAVSLGPTATTAGADIVVALCTYSAVGTVVAGSGYTLSTTDHVNTNTSLFITVEYLIDTGAAAETATLTLPASSVYHGIIQTFKTAAAGTFVASPPKVIGVAVPRASSF